MLTVKVIKPGLFTTIQDQGRWAYAHLGVPVSGAMDRAAAARANELVGNSHSTPVLEITISGPQLQFSARAILALTGADLSPTIDGVEVRKDCSFEIQAGQLLAFGACKSGCRAYLAIAGEWQVDYWLGSASRALPPAAEATPLGVLQAGMSWQIDSPILPLSIPVRDSKIENSQAHTPSFQDFRSPKERTIYVQPGPEYARLSKAWWAAFYMHSFTISKAANRMGCRLEERLRVPLDIGNMFSSGILPGTVQLTPAGKLIILLADAQTTGGYFRILQLCTRSQDVMAQLKPGDKVRFVRCSA